MTICWSCTDPEANGYGRGGGVGVGGWKVQLQKLGWKANGRKTRGSLSSGLKLQEAKLVKVVGHGTEGPQANRDPALTPSHRANHRPRKSWKGGGWLVNKTGAPQKSPCASTLCNIYRGRPHRTQKELRNPGRPGTKLTSHRLGD